MVRGRESAYGLNLEMPLSYLGENYHDDAYIPKRLIHSLLNLAFPERSIKRGTTIKRAQADQGNKKGSGEYDCVKIGSFWRKSKRKFPFPHLCPFYCCALFIDRSGFAILLIHTMICAHIVGHI